jgi:Phosphoesterase family
LPGNVPDSRFPADLPNGPFQISRYAAYSDFVGDPVHRFFQMRQGVSKDKRDLFVWVADTAGIGNHNDGFGTGSDDTHQGGVAMGFYNVNTGDAPFFKQMADLYAIGDNYRQPVMGGTGANFLSLVTGDAAFYNANGVPAVPPTSFTYQGTQTSQVENPNPQSAGSNTNWYTEDGYRGGSYVNCADTSQPGVSPITTYLGTLKVKPNCAANYYYLVNNYNLGYQADGTLANPSNERNWGLSPLSGRSRDNLPNAIQPAGTYVPINGPAIGDLANLFDFGHFRANAPAIRPSVGGNRDHGEGDRD